MFTNSNQDQLKVEACDKKLITNNDNQRSFARRKMSETDRRNSYRRVSQFFLPLNQSTAIHIASEQIRTDFAIFKQSKHWESFEGTMVRLMKISEDHLRDVNEAPLKLFILQSKLRNYLFELAKEEYVYAYMQLLNYICHDIWKAHLLPVLARCENQLLENKERYQQIIDELLEKIIATFRLNSCSQNEYEARLVELMKKYTETVKLDKNIQINDLDLIVDLAIANLPAEIRENFTPAEIEKYTASIGKLVGLIKKARTINAETDPKNSTSDNMLKAEHVDLSYHFTSIKNILEKYKEYLKNHFDISNSEVERIINYITQNNIMDGIIGAVKAKALLQADKDLLPEIRLDQVDETVYINHRYLCYLFLAMNKYLLVSKNGKLHLANNNFADQSINLGQQLLDEWLQAIRSNS